MGGEEDLLGGSGFLFFLPFVLRVERRKDDGTPHLDHPV
jgi:hypothetical protein